MRMLLPGIVCAGLILPASSASAQTTPNASGTSPAAAPAIGGVAAQESDGETGTTQWLDRTDPERWDAWRCGPMPFPNLIQPEIPESLAEPAITFGQEGADLVIVTPDHPGTGYDDRALQAMVRMISSKTRKAQVISADKLAADQKKAQLLVVGTPGNNSFIREMLGANTSGFFAGIPAGGYHVKAVPSPFQQGREVILAVGADPAGAWPAAGILAYSIHPVREGLSQLQPWPVPLPDGLYWAPFEAKYTLSGNALELPPVPVVPPQPPLVPFGVRIWGSPIPTLESFQRLVRALKPLGINTILIQGGGWPDLPDAPEIYRKAVDIAWREGIFTIIYVGNEMAGHLPAALTPNHKAIVLAVKDEPGLLGWHLYNQLSARLTPAQFALVKDQMHWLTGVSTKPVGVEVVWGQKMVEMPADKIQLVTNLKSWGMTEVANDYAPIGGWTDTPDLTHWEGRLLQLQPFGLPVQAVLQAHVAFLKPTIPSAVQVRNEFWWAVAGGARAFFFETAYLFTHISVRGILGWDLHPLPDGRYDEIRNLAGIAKKIEPVLVNSLPGSDADIAASGISLEPAGTKVALRLRHGRAGVVYLLLINPSLDSEAQVRIVAGAKALAFKAQELAPGSGTYDFDEGHKLAVTIPPGGGACYQLTPVK